MQRITDSAIAASTWVSGVMAAEAMVALVFRPRS
jgi:hypothetical protein